MQTLQVKPTLDTHILSYRADQEHYQEQNLIVQNFMIGQTLMKFDFNLPNSTILDFAWLYADVTALVNMPTLRARRLSLEPAQDETWNSFENGQLDKCTGLEYTGILLPNGKAAINVTGAVQNWLMIPSSNRGLCIYLNDPDPQSKVELASMETLDEPYLLLQY